MHPGNQKKYWYTPWKHRNFSIFSNSRLASWFANAWSFMNHIVDDPTNSYIAYVYWVYCHWNGVDNMSSSDIRNVCHSTLQFGKRGTDNLGWHCQAVRDIHAHCAFFSTQWMPQHNKTKKSISKHEQFVQHHSLRHPDWVPAHCDPSPLTSTESFQWSTHCA